jgi:MFS family permease
MSLVTAALPQVERSAPPAAAVAVSRRSRLGLNAANFFLAEMTGVVMPFLGKYLKQHGWSETALGVAISAAGLGVFLTQTPSGFLVDRIRQRRALLAGVSLLVGVCLGIVPLVPARPECLSPLLFVAGVGQSFFGPLLGALALGLVGQVAVGRMVGANQGWNHAGNIAAALTTMLLAGWLGVSAVFYTGLAVSILAAGSVFLVRGREVDESRASGGDGQKASILELLRDRRVIVLFAATALFHLANAPVMPFVGAYIDTLGGSSTQVAAVVLVAQVVMVPVAVLTGWLCDRLGRKPAFAIGFLALPVRIFLYSLTRDPWGLVALQALDGIGAGVYGVAVVAMVADLTAGRGRFNALQGLIANALAVGGVAGPLGAGWLAQHLGYNGFFYTFAGIAAVAAAVFVLFMPETRPADTESKCA